MSERRLLTAEEIEASFVLAIAVGSARELKRMPIAMMGVRYKGAQKIEITREMLGQVVRNFRGSDLGQVPVDYDHAMEFAAGAGAPVPAAGWIKGLDDVPDTRGILWGSVEWTPAAEGMIAAGEYRYVSPVLDPKAKNNKTGADQGWTLRSAALTNQPVLQGMPPLVLSELTRDAGGEKEKRVKVTKLILADRVAAMARVILEDNTETTLKVEGLEAPAKILRLSDVPRDGKTQAYDFTRLDCSGDVVVAGEVFRAQQAQSALDAAIAAGKILPAQRPAYEKMALADLPGFQSLVASMKPQIDLKVRGTGATEGEGSVPVAVRIDTKVREKIVASEGKRDYAEALKMVLRENPDLADEYKGEMNRGGAN